MCLKCLIIKTLRVLGYIFTKVKKPTQSLTALNRNPNKTGKCRKAHKKESVCNIKAKNKL